ncbi:MAG TPA: hypothetical protein VK848_06880 [Acidimicrobiia bacterium]|nr:hypothetical protein [Acidimicrobiia bacterium]
MTRRGLRAGVALAGLYAAAVLATSLLTGHPVRPLFDGASTNTPYQWVKPPWYVGSVNVKPTVSHTDIAFANGVSPLTGVNSADAQIILNLPQGSLPSHAGDTAVRATFTPLDPKKLAKPPGDMRADGNAYRVDMTYQPSGAPVTNVTTSGNVIMVVPDEAEKMMFSLDGKSWDELPTHLLGDPNTVGSAFNKPGYYLVGTALPEFTNPNKGNSTKRVAGIVLVVVAVALLLGYVVPNALRRSRAAQSAGRGGTRRPGSAKTGRSAGAAGRGRTRQVRRQKR